MDDLESLELLSLVSKVTLELNNHLGINEKTLAEFVIAQHSQCKSLDEFKTKLDAMGAEFPHDDEEEDEYGRSRNGHKKSSRRRRDEDDQFKNLQYPRLMTNRYCIRSTMVILRE